jgi:hypothetical protein
MENLFAYGTLMCEDIMRHVAGCRFSHGKYGTLFTNCTNYLLRKAFTTPEVVSSNCLFVFAIDKPISVSYLEPAWPGVLAPALRGYRAESSPFEYCAAGSKHP